MAGQVIKIPTLNPASSFGLNTTSKATFDPFASPKTQGAFNKQVLQAAQPQYMPQLQSIQSQMNAENAVTGQRTGDIKSIYNQYQSQATDAYNQLKSDLAAIQAQVAPGSAEANLGAALSSAIGGQNTLATMMGSSTLNPTAASLPYLGASEAQHAAAQQLANAGESAALQVSGGNVANVGNERATELNTESLRHQGAIGGFQTQEQQLAAQIPGIIEKARTDLINSLQSGANLKFQQGLANKQFGLSKSTEAATEAQNKAQLKETTRVDTANINQGQQTINQNQQKILSDIAATNASANTAIATAKGKAQADALKYLQGALTMPTSDYQTVVTTDPKTGNKTTTKAPTAQAIKNWHVDVGSILKTIMTQYGIPQDQALQMMSSLGGRVYISGQGGQTVADWANTFNARNKARALGVGKTATNIAQGITNTFHF